MKKTIYSLILVVASLAALTACSKKDFDSKYYDPSKTTTVTPDKMMTGTFMAGRDYTYNAYWRMYTWDNYFGKLAQTIGFGVQSGTMYFINDGYASDRWGYEKAFLNVLNNNTFKCEVDSAELKLIYADGKVLKFERMDK